MNSMSLMFCSVSDHSGPSMPMMLSSVTAGSVEVTAGAVACAPASAGVKRHAGAGVARGDAARVGLGQRGGERDPRPGRPGGSDGGDLRRLEVRAGVDDRQVAHGEAVDAGHLEVGGARGGGRGERGRRSLAVPTAVIVTFSTAVDGERLIDREAADAGDVDAGRAGRRPHDGPRCAWRARRDVGRQVAGRGGRAPVVDLRHVAGAGPAEPERAVGELLHVEVRVAGRRHDDLHALLDRARAVSPPGPVGLPLFQNCATAGRRSGLVEAGGGDLRPAHHDLAARRRSGSPGRRRRCTGRATGSTPAPRRRRGGSTGPATSR